MNTAELVNLNNNNWLLKICFLLCIFALLESDAFSLNFTSRIYKDVRYFIDRLYTNLPMFLSILLLVVQVGCLQINLTRSQTHVTLTPRRMTAFTKAWQLNDMIKQSDFLLRDTSEGETLRHTLVNITIITVIQERCIGPAMSRSV
jgi:hypothetical protein